MQIQCGQCGQLLEVPEGSEGQRTFCPRCGVSLEIPDPAKPAEPSPSDSFPSENGFSETVIVGSDSPASPPPPQPSAGPSPPAPPDSLAGNPYAAPSTFPGHPGYRASAPNVPAIIAFCLGLGSVGALMCCCVTPIPAFLGVPAMITGTFGMIASRKPGGVGGGFALTGIIFGILATLVSTTLFLFAMLS